MMEKRTVGIVHSVTRQWWLKVNTRAVRFGPLDGARFPHIVKVRYTVEGREIVKRKWLGARFTPPCVGEEIDVIYREDKPTRCRLEPKK